MERRGRPRARELVVPVRKRRSASLPTRATYDNAPLQPNWDKLQQVLDYSRSLDKLSQIIGEDIETVKDIKTEQLEQEMTIERTIAIPPSRKTSQKALNMLGHNPSEEKAKRTLGLGATEMERVRSENLEMEEDRLQKKRAIDNPYDKKYSAKAFATLGFDPSEFRSMKLLGLSEDTLKQALLAESARLEQAIARRRRNVASRNRKDNKKALTVVGHDPSKEKAVNKLGEEALHEVNAIVSA
eukprot:Phypoly_transcript_16077.p1 GENE.Phypoly_transcript_16077~~Phypoly_transcript_16077.p1  ORF type:complete len:242 (-),score=36.92 Phypoly_transcript_16077:69-794(-)